MKCPQCGSGMTDNFTIYKNELCSYNKKTYEFRYCENCGYGMKEKQKEDFKYQRRLDNVLSKMTQLGKKYYGYEKEYKGACFFVLDYDCEKKQFYLMKTETDRCQNFEHVYMPIDVDLAEKLIETVESLLNDLKEAE